MIRIGTVWDDTLARLDLVRRPVVEIALLAMFLPAVAAAAVGIAAPRTVFATLASILSGLASFYGSLALIDVAVQAEDARRAFRRAGAVFPRALGVSLLVAAVFAMLALPLVALLIHAGLDLSAMMADRAQPRIDPARLGGAVIYALLYGLAGLILGARLLLLRPVLVMERVGLAAIRRSLVLTRGLTGKLVGVILLYALVMSVALGAIGWTGGAILQLLLGEAHPFLAALLGACLTAAVTTAFGVLAAVFSARLYVATAGEAATLA